MKKICIFLAVTLLMASCSGDSYRKASGETWGTFYNITYRSDKDLHDSIRAIMHLVDTSLSPFCHESTVDRINRGETAVADSLFVTVFREAQRISRLSGGHFDPTVAPLVNLWGFGYKQAEHTPSDEEIASALEAVGIADCTLRGDTIIKKSPETEFDFSAIAKGFGCDMVAQMLRRNGCTDFLVEIGGEMTLSGVNDRGEEWHIQVDAPVDQMHRRADIITATNCGIASSGNYRNYRDTKDGRIGHTISPSTGRPVASELLSVTVIAPTCMEADALATACMAMPMAQAREMIERAEGVGAIFITSDDNGGFKITKTAMPFEK